MQLLEAGKIINTHGVRGEVKIDVYCDSAAFLAQFPVLYLQGAPRKVLSARPHKHFLLVQFEGVLTVQDAMALKNQLVFLDKADVTLPEGQYFYEEIFGFRVYDAFLEREIGVLDRVLQYPAQDIYVVKDGQREILIPAVAPFYERLDRESRTLFVRTIEGMVEV